jgi:hypothetical protein
VQLRCALLKAHQVEAPRAKDNKGQRQHNRHLAEGRQRGWDGGMMREQPGSQQDPKIHTQKKEMQEVRVAPTSSAKWPIEITGDKEDAVIAEDCRTTTG